MMTYAPPGQPGHHHVNCQLERYWIEALESIGFQFDGATTQETRAIASPGHYRKHGLFFVRR